MHVIGLVHRLANNSDAAAGQSAAFQGTATSVPPQFWASLDLLPSL